MRILKDFINGQITLENNYTNDELLALMYFSHDQNYIDDVLDYTNSSLRSSLVIKMIDYIKPDDKSKTFDIFQSVISSLGVTIHEKLNTIIGKTYSKLSVFRIDITDVEISIHDFITDRFGNKYIIFKVNERYFCDFNEFYYDDDMNNTYSIVDDLKIYKSGVYGLYFDDTTNYAQSHSIFDFVRGEISLPVNIRMNPHICIYRFETKDEFEKSKKMFETNPKLAKQIYIDNQIKKTIL